MLASLMPCLLAAQIGDRHVGLILLQDPDDLLLRKVAAPHALVLVVGQNELQTGLSPRGKVTLYTPDGSGLQKGDVERPARQGQVARQSFQST